MPSHDIDGGRRSVYYQVVASWSWWYGAVGQQAEPLGAPEGSVFAGAGRARGEMRAASKQRRVYFKVGAAVSSRVDRDL